MNNRVCAACGHVNRADAVACEACDARLYTAEPSADEDFAEAREPFDSTGEPAWEASDTSAPGGEWSPAADAAPPAEEIPAPPFKGAGDVISPMLAVYRKHFTLVGILVLVVTVPEALVQYGLLRATTAAFEHGGPVQIAGPGSTAAAVASGVLLWMLTVAGAALLSGALVYAVVDVQRAGSAAAGACLARGLKALPNVFLVSLLYGLITLAGYVMLIVPGVIFSLMFAVCVPAAIVEGLGPVDALKRSHELTKGNKGLIFITFFLWGVLITVLSGIVSWSFANNGNLGLLPTLLLQTAIQGMLTSTSHVLTVYIYLGLLRERRSGFSANTFTPGPEVAAR